MNNETSPSKHEQPADHSEQNSLCIYIVSDDTEKKVKDVVSPEAVTARPMDLNDLYYILMDGPLVRSDFGPNHIVQMTADEFEVLLNALGADEFKLIDIYGRPIRIVRGCISKGKKLMIRHTDLGEQEGKPHLGIVG